MKRALNNISNSALLRRPARLMQAAQIPHYSYQSHYKFYLGAAAATAGLAYYTK